MPPLSEERCRATGPLGTLGRIEKGTPCPRMLQQQRRLRHRRDFMAQARTAKVVLQAPKPFSSWQLMAWIMAGDEARNRSFSVPGFSDLVWYCVSWEIYMFDSQAKQLHKTRHVVQTLFRDRNAQQRSCTFTFLRHLKLGRRLVQVLEWDDIPRNFHASTSGCMSLQ